ncbi:hypothetical protein J2128_000361 [Methanomicrobium sp. W14]|uniref:hypothetical protein n=1 Tax=Methanomicrobium sp. W14 TaxID=2817839 RepID=UPI001AE1B602|nr:hypothetical protein [Methanomicrobium sp. W14]MBP2132440.1 hypothetical protein [Methanomicrobium sp. W14]
MRIYAQVSGEESCLVWLADILKDKDPKIVREYDGSYGFRSSLLDKFEKDTDIADAAYELVSRINVLLSL